MQISGIEREHLPDCARLYAQVFSRKPWYETWTRQLAQQRLEHFFYSQGFIGLMAREESKILGIVLGNCEPYLQTQTFYLRDMCVATEAQRQGVGSLLLEGLHRELKRQEVSRSYLITGREMSAYKFYLQHGYTNQGCMAFLMSNL